MSASQWHKFYSASIATTPDVLFDLLTDMPIAAMAPGSAAFGATTDVDPYPVRLGSRYHDGKPGQPGKDWWGTGQDSAARRAGFPPRHSCPAASGDGRRAYPLLTRAGGWPDHGDPLASPGHLDAV